MFTDPSKTQPTELGHGHSNHLPALDGLRAWAVIAVTAFHYRFSHAQAGYLGVDIFFVLSGFLITRLLVDEHARTNAIDLRAFALRRLARLSPAVLLLLAVLAIVQLPTGRNTGAEVGQLLSALFYVNNWYGILSSSTVPATTTEHLWSLSIEGQFYLAWPLVVRWLVTRRCARRTSMIVGCLLGALAALGLQLAMYATGATWSEIYLNSFSRSGGLLIGSAVALMVSGGDWTDADRRSVGEQLLSATRRVAGTTAAQATLATGLGAAVFFGLDQGNTAPRWALLTIVAGLTGGLVLSVVEAPFLGPARLLSGPRQRWVAQRSYAIYLWHLPLRSLPLGAVGRVSGAGWIIPLTLTLLISDVTYRLVEVPARRFVSDRLPVRIPVVWRRRRDLTDYR